MIVRGLGQECPQVDRQKIQHKQRVIGITRVDQPLDELSVRVVEYGPAAEQPCMSSPVRTTQEEAGKMIVFELQRF